MFVYMRVNKRICIFLSGRIICPHVSRPIKRRKFNISTLINIVLSEVDKEGRNCLNEAPKLDTFKSNLA